MGLMTIVNHKREALPLSQDASTYQVLP